MFINSRCRCRNFNRRLLLEEEFVEKCVEIVEILLNGQSLWSGFIKKGSGKESSDFSTKIKLKESIFEIKKILNLKINSLLK